MEDKSLRNKVLTSFLWRFAERTGAELVTFIVSIVVARILDPGVYGLVAMSMVFLSISKSFIDSGLGSALIQKKEADEVDFSSVFYFNLVAGLLLYGVIWFAAPGIANFYHDTSLVEIIRVLGISLPIYGINNVQCAFVSRTMAFKRFFYATIVGTIISAIAGIGLAVSGYGVWALIAQTLINSLMDTIILWYTVRWRPVWRFSWQRLWKLWHFGWKLMASGLIDRVYGELYSLIIGRKYTADDLAFYNKGQRFPSMLVSNINSSINSVLLPAMSSVQDNTDKVREMTRQAIKVSSYTIMPMMMGLAVCADSIIAILLTEKWLFCVPYLRIACFTYAFYPLHTANLNAIKAMGRSDVFLKLEILKKITGLALIIPAAGISVLAMAYSGIIQSVTCQIINSYPNKKFLGYSYLSQLKDMLPQIALSLVMGALVYPVKFMGFNPWLTLIIQVPLGILLYVAGSFVFKVDTYFYIWRIVRPVMDKVLVKIRPKNSQSKEN